MDDDEQTKARIARLGRAVGGEDLSALGGQGKLPGDQFVASEGYKRIIDPAARGSHWTSGPVEIKAGRWGGVQTKATLLEGDMDTPGSGGALVPYDIRPGTQPILFERPTVADLLATATTDSNKVRVVVETVADPGSIGTVEEGAPKPEATLEFTETDEPVRKVASFLPASDEMISDAPGLRAYLNSRLGLFVAFAWKAALGPRRYWTCLSLPAPPLRVSLPGPPFSVSFPALPLSLSLPFWP
jgi:Phage capsid family